MKYKFKHPSSLTRKTPSYEDHFIINKPICLSDIVLLLKRFIRKDFLSEKLAYDGIKLHSLAAGEFQTINTGGRPIQETVMILDVDYEPEIQVINHSRHLRDMLKNEIQI